MPEQQAQPDSSAQRRRQLVTAAVAVLVLAGLAAVGWLADITSGFSGAYLCARCGAAEMVTRRAILGVTYYRHAEVIVTPVSRVLNARGKQPCEHAWQLIVANHSWGTLLGWQGVADGATSFGTMCELAYDDGFARQLGQRRDAREVWQTLWRADLASENETERLLSGWWRPAGKRQPFAQWWASHEAHIRQLGSAPAR